MSVSFSKISGDFKIINYYSKPLSSFILSHKKCFSTKLKFAKYKHAQGIYYSRVLCISFENS